MTRTERIGMRKELVTRILILGLALTALMLASTAGAASHQSSRAAAVAGTNCDGAFHDAQNKDIAPGDPGDDAGSSGDDAIDAGVGNDAIDAGTGNDAIDGGTGD